MGGFLLIVSGPAGSGKNTVCERLIAERQSAARAITTTTRAPRDGERDGVDYYFTTPEAFERGIKNGDFYEWAKVHGRYYGTTKREILDKLSSGKNVILIIDVQGAKTWREAAKSDERIAGRVNSVFIKPASLDVIRERMALRGDSAEEIEKRLQTAKTELGHEKYFDRSIISASRDEDFANMCAIYDSICK